VGGKIAGIMKSAVPTLDRIHATMRQPVRGDAAWKLPKQAPMGPPLLPEPVCRWTFQEPAGELRWSEGAERYALREMAGAAARVEDGVLGPYSTELREGQWFNLPRAECAALNFGGAGATFSVVAWVKRQPKSNHECQAVAGMWNETVATRQYCLFIDLSIWDSMEQVCGHVSAKGAPTPGYKYCMEAAIGATRLKMGEWQQVAFTFDGVWARVFVDGKMDYRPGLNPYYWPHVINDGGPAGSDFTVGAVYRGGSMGNWFTGRLGGLAVYREALSEEAMAWLHAARKA
jgi:hypothetical protein